MSLSLLNKLNLYAILLLSIMIPFIPFVVPVCILLLLISSLLNYKKTNRQKLLLLFPLMFLLYLLDIVFFDSSRIITKAFAYEKKLSFIIFGIIFFASSLDVKYYLTSILKAFLFGLTLCIFMLFGMAFYRLIMLSQPVNTFFYNELSFYFHPSYLSAYFNFGLCILIYLRKTISSILFKTLFILFSIMVLCLVSKIGIITLVVIYLCLIVYLIVKKQYKTLGFLLVLFLVFGVWFYNMKRVTERFSEMKEINTTSSKSQMKSTSVRLSLWQASWQAIKKAPILGYGLGEQQVLNEHMKAITHLPDVDKKNLNAHNLILEQFFALGIIRLLLFFLITFLIPCIYAIRRRNGLHIALFVIIGFLSLTESTFETQAGIVFFMFFNTLLFTHSLASKLPECNKK